MSSDTKWIIGSIIGTGGVIATLLLTLTGLMVQQNAGVNTRIDDAHQRIDDVQADIRELRTEIRELRTEIQADIRELRALVIEALKRTETAD